MTTMHFTGTVNSEETMKGALPDGRTIYVELLTAYESAPEDQRDEPLYWFERWQRGEFDDPENPPRVWVK